MLKKLIRKFTDADSRADTLYHFAFKYINPWLRKLGFTLVAHHYYQTIPDDHDTSIYHDKPRPLDMIDWKLNHQKDFTESLLSEYSEEFNDPNILGAGGYEEGPYPFSSGEAEFYFALLRKLKPRKIIEIGAGGSSLVCLAALMMNFEQDDIKADYTSIEPFPGEEVKEIQRKNHSFVNYTLIESKLQDVDESLFRTLNAGDILFVDSTHVYKQGSDVEYEFLRVYPHLQPGVYVHIHDIFLPNDYPEGWNKKYFRFWNEQYHLETFLMYNHRFEILAGLNMLHHYHYDLFKKYINVYHKNRFPGSFWMKVKEEGE